MTEFWAAIVGAVVGGVLAIAAQMAASHFAERAKKVSLAKSLLLKLVLIHSNLFLLRRQLDDQLKDAEATGLGPDTWQKIRPIANVADNVTFSSDELLVLCDLKDLRFANSMIDLDGAHNRTLAIAVRYSACRSELARTLPADFGVASGSIRSDDPRVIHFIPQIHEAETLARALVQRTTQYEEYVRDQTTKLRTVFAKQFDIRQFPDLRS